MIGLVLGICLVQYLLSIPIAVLVNKLMKIPAPERGIYKNFLMFTNNGFMGFPVALALFGHQGMFYLVLANCVMNIVLFTIGTANLRNTGEEKLPLGRKLKTLVRDVVDVPIIALILGFIILLLQIRLPVELKDVLTSVGSMMAPLCMIVIGLQLTASKPRDVMLNHRFIIISLLRLIILPGLFFLILLPFHADRLMVCVLTLNVMLPCATVPVALAEEHGRDVKLAAEGTFLSTLFSMITIPIGGVLLSFLL
jgi:predicted permease